MDLVLFRHGIAEPLAGEVIHDADRALTPRGIERTTLAAHGLARIIDRPEVILTSPKTRAAQTAALVSEAFDLTPEVCPVLASGDPAAVLRMLRDRREGRVLIVGHEPVLSELITLLCLGDDAGAVSFVDFKKAGAALVTGPIRRSDIPGPATLEWLIPPRILRTLAER